MKPSASGGPTRSGPTIATLLLALGGPPLLTIVGRHTLGDSPTVVWALPLDLAFWAMLAVVLWVVVRVERQPLASIGLHRPRWSTLAWALVLLVGISFLIVPAVMRLVHAAGLPGYESGLARLMRLPAWYRVFLAVSAGVVEEVLYRGYAVERLAALTGSHWRGGALAVGVFTLAHVPAWGIGPLPVFFAASAVATAFYLWQRDLVALMIAHALGDAIGLVWLPPSVSG
jgi:membrane protease YdiL (CAAX protease family)